MSLKTSSLEEIKEGEFSDTFKEQCVHEDEDPMIEHNNIENKKKWRIRLVNLFFIVSISAWISILLTLYLFLRHNWVDVLICNIFILIVPVFHLIIWFSGFLISFYYWKNIKFKTECNKIIRFFHCPVPTK